MFITNLDLHLKKSITIYQSPIVFNEITSIGMLYAASKLLILSLALLQIANDTIFALSTIAKGFWHAQPMLMIDIFN